MKTKKKKQLGKKGSTTVTQRKAKSRQPLLLAYDLGGTKLASAVVTTAGKVLGRHVEPVEFTQGPDGFLAFLEKRARFWMEKFPAVKVLGIASAGPLDVKTGTLLQPTNFPRWGYIALTKPLSRKLKMPVGLQNDAAAAALAEGWHGGARKMKNWIVLTLGTGLGTGIVMNREVFMGGSGFGPEAGHMIVTDRPYPCGCGNNGCAESVLSGTGLNNRIKERKLPYKNSRELVQAARRGESAAREVFAEYASILARTVHNLSVMYKPEAIFFAGGVSEASDLFLDEARIQAEALLQGREGFMPKMTISKLDGDLGIIGGAYVALETLGRV